MMHFVIGVEVGHIDLSTKAKSRHEFVVIVIQHDIAHLMEGLLVLAPGMVGHIMQRRWLRLDSVAGCEIYADYHGHLHSIGQIIREIVLHCLLEILKHHQPLLRALFSQSITQIASA